MTEPTLRTKLIDVIRDQLMSTDHPISQYEQDFADAIIAIISSKHKFWGAGEADCPREIKAGNGELHTLRCKKCGLDDPRDKICLGEAV